METKKFGATASINIDLLGTLFNKSQSPTRIRSPSPSRLLSDDDDSSNLSDLESQEREQIVAAKERYAKASERSKSVDDASMSQTSSQKWDALLLLFVENIIQICYYLLYKVPGLVTRLFYTGSLRLPHSR